MSRHEGLREILSQDVPGPSHGDFSVRDAMVQIKQETDPVEFSESHRQEMENAQLSYVRRRHMYAQFGQPPTPSPPAKRRRTNVATATPNEDEKRQQKRTMSKYEKKSRSDKKRYKRKTVDDGTAENDQAMRLMPSAVPTEDDFLLRKPDIGFIGNVDPSEVEKGDDGFALVSTSAASAPKPRSGDIDADLPLTLQKMYIAQKTGSGTSAGAAGGAYVPPIGIPSMEGSGVLQQMPPNNHRIYERHLQAMNSDQGQYSFVISLLMNTRTCNVPINMLPPVDAILADIRRRSRAEEEIFLRQAIPNSGERSCVKGQTCQGMFVEPTFERVPLVEYQPPEVCEEFRQTGKWPSKVNMCVMCQRNYVNGVHVNVVAKCLSYDYSSVEQASRARSSGEGNLNTKPLMASPYSNLVGEGEYSPWDIQISSPDKYTSLFEPVVLHRVYMYEQYRKDGIWWYRQKIPVPNRHLRYGGGLDFDASMSTMTTAKRV